MKITLTESEFCNRFKAVRPDQFSREALGRLFAWTEEIEQETGVETEFDPVAICTEWSEFNSFVEAAEAYDWDGAKESDDERADINERLALEWLFDRTTVLELSKGCLVLWF